MWENRSGGPTIFSPDGLSGLSLSLCFLRLISLLYHCPMANTVCGLCRGSAFPREYWDVLPRLHSTRLYANPLRFNSMYKKKVWVSTSLSFHSQMVWLVLQCCTRWTLLCLSESEKALTAAQWAACRHCFVCVDKSGWREVFQETGPVTLEVLLLPPYRAEWKKAVSIHGPRGPINLLLLPQSREHFLLGNTSSSEGSQYGCLFYGFDNNSKWTCIFHACRNTIIWYHFILGVLLWSKK